MKKCAAPFLFMFLVACASPAAATNLPNAKYTEIGENAEKGDKTAAAFILSEAQRGVPAAENQLANHYSALYRYKTDVPDLGRNDPDYEASLYWWQRAANHGYAPAATNLGQNYIYSHFGNETDNHREAAKWFRMAAEQGFRKARYALFMLWFRDNVNSSVAICDVKGTNCRYSSAPPPLSQEEAMKWLHLAAEQGHPESALYLSGYLGEEKSKMLDYREAYFWVSLGLMETRSAGETPDGSFERQAGRYAKNLSADEKAAVEQRVGAWKPAPMQWDEK